MVVGTRAEILLRIGAAIRRERLRQNLSRETVALRSGVSLNAVKNLEAGNGTTLGTFVLVCRTIGKDSWINAFTRPDDDPSPIELAELLEKGRPKERMRAGRVSRK